MNITPCSLGPIDWVRPFPSPMHRIAGCACGFGFQAHDDAGIRDQYAQHLLIERPPAEVLAKDAPTIEDVERWPHFFIGGPGSRAARPVRCPHGDSITAVFTCPGCIADYRQRVAG